MRKKQNRKQVMRNRLLVVTSLITMGIATRFIPHWPNFTAVGAVALFAGATVKRSYLAYLIPMFVLFISDLFMNNLVYQEFSEGFTWFSSGFAFIYGAFLLTTIMGRYSIKGTPKPLPIAGTSIASAVVFFLITNFGVWLSGPLYPKTIGGLISAYEAGIPFLLNMSGANLFYSAVLFGAAYYALPKYETATVKN